MNFRTELQKLIVKKQISIAKLARRADIHQSTIYNYLKGESEMTAGKLEKLFNLLEEM